MKEINKFINNINLNASVKTGKSKQINIDEKSELIRQRLLDRLQREVPENGIFSPVFEQIEDNSDGVASYKFSCEYSKNQISKKKDKRTLKIYYPNSKNNSQNSSELINGTKQEIVDFVKQSNFSQIINLLKENKENKNTQILYNPVYGLVNYSSQKQVSFGNNSDNKFHRLDEIEKLSSEFKSVVDNPYCSEEVKNEYNKRLSFLLYLKESDLSDNRAEEIINLFRQNTCSADDAFKIASLTDEQYSCMKDIPNILGVSLSYSSMSEIASLDEDKYNMFIQLYNSKADENSYKDTLIQNSSSVPIYSYYNYCQNYAESLIPVFKSESPFYEQSLELIENGIEPICLKNINNIQLSQTQKQRVKLLNEEKIVPTAGLIELEDDEIFDLSLNIYENVNNTDIDIAVSKAKEYSLNYKTFDRFIETFKNAAKSNKFVMKAVKHFDGTVSYDCNMLDTVELISQYDDNDYIKANDLIKNGVPLKYIDEIINCNLDGAKLERAIDLINKKVPDACLIASDDNLYNSYIEKLQNGDKYKAAYSVVKEYRQKIYEKLLEQGYNISEARVLSELQGKKFNKGCKILKLVISPFSINDFLDNRAYKRTMEILSKKDSEIPSLALSSLVLLNDHNYDKASRFFDTKIDFYTICNLAECDDERYNRAIDILEKVSNISGYLLGEVVSMTEEQYEKFLYCIDKGFDFNLSHALLNFNDAEFKRALYLLNRGLNYFELQEVLHHNNKVYERILYLLDNGYNLSDSVNIAIFDGHFSDAKQRINSNQSEMHKLFQSEEYLSKLKKNSQSKYQQEVTDILSSDNITYKAKNCLMNSNLSEKEFLSSVQKFAKSTFKLAYDTPNQYLSGIDTKYTDKVDGKYPILPAHVKKEQQRKMIDFFKLHIGEIIKALNYLDIDTVNQMMDKRTEKFTQTLEELNILTTDNYKLLSDLIKCKSKDTGKSLTANDKIQLSQICLIFQRCNIDTSKLKEMANLNEVDIKLAKRIIIDKILQNAGMSDEEIAALSDENIRFNSEYMYTMLIGNDDIETNDVDIETTFEYYKEIMKSEEMTRQSFIDNFLNGLAPHVQEILLDLYDHINDYSDEKIKIEIKNAVKVQQQESDLYVVVNHAAKNDFDDFILDKSNKYGQVNANTKDAFNAKGLNFEEWINPSINDIDFELNNRKFKIKLWERNPNEDLFIGNKTSCCTAIGTGCNASATPAYLLSQSFNVVELFDDNGNAIGMSRIFMANIDGKPSVVMDNIELNQNFLKNISDEDKVFVRDNFFKYINNLSKNVTGDKDSQVYFSTSYLKVDASDLEEEDKNIDFIGEVSQDNIYLNCLKGWFIPEDIGDIPILLYKVPKN